MSFNFKSPRRVTRTFENTKGAGALSKIGVSESIIHRRTAKSHLGKAVSEIRKIANELPKEVETALRTHQIKKALKHQESVIKNLYHAIEYTAEAYDTTAQVESDIIDRILPAILTIKYLNFGGQFKFNLPIRNGRKAEVTLVNTPTKLGTREGTFDKIKSRREIRNAMRITRQVVDKLYHLVSDREYVKIMKNEKNYAELMNLLKGRDKKKTGEIKKEFAHIVKLQEELIKKFGTAVYWVTEEYDDVVFLESDICKIIDELLKVNIASSDQNKPLLPPSEIYKFQQSMLTVLPLFRRWVNIAYKDQYAFQDTLRSSIAKIQREPNLRGTQYSEFLLKVLDCFYNWVRIGTVDHFRLDEKVNNELNQLQGLSSRLRM